MPELRDKKTGIEHPSAIVRYARYSQVVAVFQFAKDALRFVAQAEYPDMYVVENVEGTRIVGTTAHGWAILEKLRDAGRV